MKKYLWNIAKTALIFAAIGAGLAIAMPHVAIGLGIAKALSITYATGANVLFQGIFFGLFGGSSAAITPLIEKATEGKPLTPPPALDDKDVAVLKEVSQAVQQAYTPELVVNNDPPRVSFAQQEAERRLAAQQQNITTPQL